MSNPAVSAAMKVTEEWDCLSPFQRYVRAEQLVAQVQLLRSQNEGLVKALEEISEGAGRFSRDPLEHASNTISDMKALALEALKRHAQEGE